MHLFYAIFILNLKNNKNYVYLIYFQGYQLNVGGHQLRLHNGVPPQKPKYHASDLDNIPVVPGASILVRVLPTKAVSISISLQLF